MKSLSKHYKLEHGTMDAKKIFQISALVSTILLLVTTIYISNLNLQKRKIGTKTTMAEGESAVPEYIPADNKIEPEQWAEFVHPELNYRFRYPQEFQVEKRGKIGNLEDLVALNYSTGNKRLTVVKIQLTNEAPAEKTLVSQKGQDNNGNEVIVYKLPYGDSKTLTLIGTAYPNIGSNFRFEAVIQKIAQTMKES